MATKGSFFETRDLPISVWIFVLIAYVVTLICSGVLTMERWANRMERTFARSIVVQIPKDLQRGKVEHFFRESELVGAYHHYKDKELSRLLAPWVQSKGLIRSLSVPPTYRVILRHRKDLVLFETLLPRYARGAVVTKSAPFARALQKNIRPLRFVLYEMALFLVLVDFIVVFFLVRFMLRVNKTRLHILNLLGATNRYVLGRFRRRVFKAVFFGTFLGGVLAFCTVTAIRILAFHPVTWLPTTLLPWRWWVGVGVGLFLLVGLVDRVAMLAARKTLRRFF